MTEPTHIHSAEHELYITVTAYLGGSEHGPLCGDACLCGRAALESAIARIERAAADRPPDVTGAHCCDCSTALTPETVMQRDTTPAGWTTRVVELVCLSCFLGGKPA